MMLDRTDDTIIAVATPPGKSGIGIIRISGTDSIRIAGKICRLQKYSALSELPSNRMNFTRIAYSGKIIDEGMVTVMRAPHSFTGENSVELNLHGSPVILNRIVEILIKIGARPANPGEFTGRAFINGKMDLTRAEAVEDIINAKTLTAAEMAVNQLKGEFYHQILEFKKDISWVLALLDAGIDFSDEDISFSEFSEITEKLTAIICRIDSILKDAECLTAFKEGLKMTLYGRPNAGKSSLMNGLLKKSRSIITDIPGTTRDTVSDFLDVNGIPLHITDTAGIRKTADLIELEGIRRARDSAHASDLVLWIIDCTNPFYNEDFSGFPDEVKILPVFNKTDLGTPSPDKLPLRFHNQPHIGICCLNDGDIQKLSAFVYSQIIGEMIPTESAFMVNIRQKTCLNEARQNLNNALNNHTQREFTEIISHALSQSLYNLGMIVGETTPDDMLNRIFSSFCIGK